MREAAIGVDLGGTKLALALVDRQGVVHHHKVLPTEAHKGAAHVLDNMIQGVQDVAFVADREGIAVTGIGIGSAGQIDAKSGSVAHAGDTLPGWTGTPLRTVVSERFKLPTYVDNDVNVIAVAEKMYGVAQGLDSFVCVALGTGIGGAVVERGELVRGVFGGAGEIGHMSVDFNGPRCYCGNYGCLELYASGSGIARLAHVAGWSQETSAREVISRWQVQDEAAMEIVKQMIDALATAIAGLVHILNPQAIVIGGGVADIGEPLFAVLREAVRERTFPSMFSKLSLLPAQMGSHAGVIGAAGLVWQSN